MDPEFKVSKIIFSQGEACSVRECMLTCTKAQILSLKPQEKKGEKRGGKGEREKLHFTTSRGILICLNIACIEKDPNLFPNILY